MSAASWTTFDEMAAQLREFLIQENIAQSHLAKLVGRSAKHVNMVLNGKAVTKEIDLWAATVGVRFDVMLVRL